MEMRRVAAVTALAGLATLLVTVQPAVGAPGQARAGQEARVDFNDDGFADLAVGAPGEDIGAVTDAGALNVLYGSASGLEPSTDVFFQGSGGVGGSLDAGDRFGSAVAKGDFNGDGIFDLAVGAPGETVGAAGAAGAVNLLMGSSGGLTGGPLYLQGNPEAGDQFGAALAAGDFDDDGIFHLAVGAPGEDIGATGSAGAVTVLFGSPAGLVAAGGQTLFQGGGAGGTAETGDAFGSALASGILGGDGIADLVVGAPGEDIGATRNAGAVNLLGGSPGGLTLGAVATQGNPEAFDLFGLAVATGDFDDTAGDDVAAGAPARRSTAARPPGPSASSTAPRAGWPTSGCCSRARRGSRAPPRASTTSGPRSRRPTATASASGTWPSAPPARTSAATWTPGRSTCWPGRRPARAAEAWSPRATRRTATSSGRPSPAGSSCTTSTTTASSTSPSAPPGRPSARRRSPARSACSPPRAAPAARSRPGRCSPRAWAASAAPPRRTTPWGPPWSSAPAGRSRPG